MTDLIKREDAIKVIEETPFIRRPILPHYLKAKINKIPSAENKGEWKFISIDLSECSECGGYGKDTMRFCPNCGCRMGRSRR